MRWVWILLQPRLESSQDQRALEEWNHRRQEPRSAHLLVMLAASDNVSVVWLQVDNLISRRDADLTAGTARRTPSARTGVGHPHSVPCPMLFTPPLIAQSFETALSFPLQINPLMNNKTDSRFCILSHNRKSYKSLIIYKEKSMKLSFCLMQINGFKNPIGFR